MGQIAVLDMRLRIAPVQVSLLVRKSARHNDMLDLFRTGLKAC